MKKILFISVLIITASFASEWKNELIAGINMTQNSNHNWTAGGEDAIVWQASLKGSSVGKFDLFNWKNQGELAYGRTRLGDEDSRKHLDKIFFESLVDYNLLNTVKPYLAGRVESQFTKSFEYDAPEDFVGEYEPVAISNFWDPGYTIEAVGISWLPHDIFNTRLGFAMKQTYSAKYGWGDDAKTADKVETFKNEPGLESISELNISWTDILKYQSRLSIFANFKGVKEIDGRWENTLNAQVAKYLVFSAGFEMLYDRDLSVDSQMRQYLTVGLTFQLL